MPAATAGSVAPDVLFAQKASAVAKCAGMDPRAMDLERFRSLAPVIFCKAYSTIYKEKLPLSVEEEPEECTQYVIEGLLDKTRVGALTLITGVDVCGGSHRAIGVLVGVLFAEGQRMWMQKQEAKAKTEASRNAEAGMPVAAGGSAEKKRLGSAPARITPTKGTGKGTGTGTGTGSLPSVSTAGARPGSAAGGRSARGGSAQADDERGPAVDDASYGDDFDGDGGEGEAAAAKGTPGASASAEKKKKGKKGKRRPRQDEEDDEEVGVGLEDALDMPLPGSDGPKSPAEVEKLMQRVEFLEKKLKAKKRASSPKKLKKRKPADGAAVEEGSGNGSNSAGALSPKRGQGLGRPGRVANRPASAPSNRANARKLQAIVASQNGEEDDAPTSPLLGPDGVRYPASSFTYDMKSGRRVLLSAEEIEARDRRRELFQLGGAKELELKSGGGGDDGSMPGVPDRHQSRPPLAPYSPPPAEPTKPNWPGPSTGHSTEGWVKKARAARDLEAREAEVRAAAVAEYTRARFFAAYQKLEVNDIVISIEHCVNCHCHNVTLRHQPKEYIANADSFLVSVAHMAHEFNLKCRVGVTRFPADITAKTRETDANSRVGAFEIQVAYRGPDNAVHTEVLHSKLSTRRWPSKQVVEKRFRAFCSKFSVPSFYVPQDMLDSQEYSEHLENPRGDGSTYAIGAGPWDSVNFAGPGLWQFRGSDYSGIVETEPKSPSKPMGPGRKVRVAVKATARPQTAVADDTPNAANTASLDTVHWGWDSRGFSVTPKFAVGDAVYVRGLSTVKCGSDALRSGLGFASSGVNAEWLGRSPMGVTGKRRQAPEAYPLLAEIVHMGDGTDESITVRPKYFGYLNVASTQFQCTKIEELPTAELEVVKYLPGSSIEAETEMPSALSNVLTLAAMIKEKIEPLPANDQGLETGGDGTNVLATMPSDTAELEWGAFDQGKDRSTRDGVPRKCRQRSSVFHALRDCVSLILSKYEPGLSSGELDGERNPVLAGKQAGELRHPHIFGPCFHPCLAYSERCLDWLEVHCSDDSGGIDVRQAELKAYGKFSAARVYCTPEIFGGSPIVSPRLGAGLAAQQAPEAAAAEEPLPHVDSEMVDPAEMGAMAVRTTDAGVSFGDNDANVTDGNATANNDEEESTYNKNSQSDDNNFASPRSARSNTSNGGGADHTAGSALKGALDPMLADFLDGLDDGDEDGDEDGEGEGDGGYSDDGLGFNSD